jgi:ureidoglycolate hydrolase
MPLTVQLGSDVNVTVTAEPLTPEAFAPFGDVVANPRPGRLPADLASEPETFPANAAPANQGTAITYSDASRVRSLYDQAPSARADPKVTIFASEPRRLAPPPPGSGGARGQVNVWILERHPFTTQTFTPLRSAVDGYLVIVAPSLPASQQDAHLPVPVDGNGDRLPGRGLPDVRSLKAFVATSSQAVTYGAGTWHAPMVTLGARGATLDFVVFQFKSGEAVEDCQEVVFKSPGSPEPKVNVVVPDGGSIKVKL